MKIENRNSNTRGRPRVERKSEILDAAERLYADIGFDKTSMADIAQAVGMSPANLYRSFKARRDIDEAIAERQLGQIEEAAWLSIRDAHRDPEAAFHKLIEIVAEKTNAMLFREGRLSELCVLAVDEDWPVVVNFVDRLRATLRHVLVEGQRIQVFDPALEPDQTADLLLAMLLRVWHPLMINLYAADKGSHRNTLSVHDVAPFLLRAIKMKNE